MNTRQLQIAISACIVMLIILAVPLFTFAIPYLTHKYNGAEQETKLIPELLNQGYTFVTPAQYFANPSAYNKTAILIHDADFKVTGTQPFINLEKQYGIRSAFYLRPDADWFTQNIPVFQQAERDGFEIGFQYDCLSRADDNTTLALQLFYAQLLYMQSFFNVTTTDYHGDNYNLNINNYLLYDGNHDVWQSLGLREVYSIEGFSYITDTDAQLQKPDVLGDLVIIQLHTDWAK